MHLINFPFYAAAIPDILFSDTLIFDINKKIKLISQPYEDT